MCGIAGFVGKGDEATLRSMIHSILYRGPDFQDVSLIENAGLAHARLAIIDLNANSNQPFFTPDKKFGMVFNGEIYNYLSVKEELLKTGKYKFLTVSDTEVLLYAYIEYGLDFFKKINGMFALAIYDFNKKELLLARDRMGKKPLYYSVVSNTLIFASELKALLQHPLVTRELNLNALNEYLTFEYVPTPHTIFKNIQKLEASEYLIFRDGAISKKDSYWKVDFQKQNISFEDAVGKLDKLLNDAVSCRLMSDVPLGVFLSGGLDSSTVAYYAQKNSTQKIKTFSVGFDEKSYDESSYANLVAKHLGMEHYQQTLTSKQCLELIPEVLGKLDEPFADPSIIPTYLLSKFTREKVTVALGGDGSDELLAGYPTFISEKFAGLLHSSPAFLIKFVNAISGILPANDKNISFDFKVKQFLKGAGYPRQYTHTLWLGSFTPQLKDKLFTAAAKSMITNSHGMDCIDTYLSEIPDANEFDKLLYSYYKTYLLDDILVKVDRASMYNSLEVRAPFLDVNVVEFLNTLPKEYKIQGYNTKRILKDVMKNKIPDEIISRPKKGFGIPLSAWLRTDLKPLCEKLLADESLVKQGLFDKQFVNGLKERHYSGKENNRKLLWNLMIFQEWYNNFGI